MHIKYPGNCTPTRVVPDSNLPRTSHQADSKHPYLVVPRYMLISRCMGPLSQLYIHLSLEPPEVHTHLHSRYPHFIPICELTVQLPS